jgi:hypothetical protein
MGKAHSGRFVLYRRNWRRFDRGWRLAPGRVPLAEFATLKEAKAEAERRETALRERINPLACGIHLHDQTNFPEPAFLDWVQDVGLTPPEPNADGLRDWAGLWFEQREAWTPAQVRHVWDAMHRLSFFEVARRPPGPRLYALLRCEDSEEIVQVPLGANSFTYQITGTLLTWCEGGQVRRIGFERDELAAEGDRESAEHLAALRDDYQRCDATERYGDPFAAPVPPVAAERRLIALEDFRFLEVVEVEVEPQASGVPPATLPTFLVCRQVLDPQGQEWFFPETESTCGQLVPVRAFWDAVAAVKHRDECQQQLHQLLDPDFFPPGWSNGTAGADALDAVFAAHSLPLLDRKRFQSAIGRDRIRMEGLQDWWRRHAHHVTAELREDVWLSLGDYGYFHVIVQFDADGRNPRFWREGA